MFQGSLFRFATRTGFYRYGSVSGQPFLASPQILRNDRFFLGLVRHSKNKTHLGTSILGNLVMKSVIVAPENVTLSCALSFRSLIHSGKPKEVEEGRTPTPMDYVQGLPWETGGGVNEQQPQETGRAPRSINYLEGLYREMGNGIDGRPSFYRQQAEAGSTLRSMDYVQGLLNEERGYGVNGQPRFYQQQGEAGRAPTPMDHVQGLLHDRRTGFGGGFPVSQPHVESNAHIVNIKLTRNNSFVTLTDSKGNKMIGVSAAVATGKGDKPGRYSAEAAAEHIGRRVRQMKIRSVVVKVSGFTFFRRKKDAILAFKDGYTHSRGDMNPVVHIEDTTRKPHNGCRRPKKRRI